MTVRFIPEIDELITKYKLTDHADYKASDLLHVIVHQLSPPYYDDTSDKKEDSLFNDLITSNKPITEIIIKRGGVEYKFNKDKVILAMFEHRLDTFNPRKLTKEELHEQSEEMFQHVIEAVRPMFTKLTYLSPRKRYLLIHDLFRLANYPFTPQQLQANDQTKASLIRNWLRRSTPKISSDTIRYAQKNHPGLDLSKQYPQFFKSDNPSVKRNKNRKISP